MEEVNIVLQFVNIRVQKKDGYVTIAIILFITIIWLYQNIMVVVAQLVEHCFVEAAVVGSIPTDHPKFSRSIIKKTSYRK